MTRINPTQIPGRWRSGFALDFHSIESKLVGHDEYGHPLFETLRTPLGELVYSLKYQRSQSAAESIGSIAFRFLKQWKPEVTCVVPVPANKQRRPQPVDLIAEHVSSSLQVPFLKVVSRSRSMPEIKNVHDFTSRLKVLDGAHTISPMMLRDHAVLLVDDLYRSGATMNAIASLILDVAGAREVFALAITRTRSSR